MPENELCSVEEEGEARAIAIILETNRPIYKTPPMVKGGLMAGIAAVD